MQQQYATDSTKKTDRLCLETLCLSYNNIIIFYKGSVNVEYTIYEAFTNSHDSTVNVEYTIYEAFTNSCDSTVNVEYTIYKTYMM